MQNQALSQAVYLIQQGNSIQAIKQLQFLTKANKNWFEAWRLLGFAYHEEALEFEAMQAFKQALRINPKDYDCAIAFAQSLFFCGLPSFDAFNYLNQLKPGDLNAVRGRAMALAVEGEYEAAQRLLTSALHQYPDWLAGHKLLASQRYTQGQTDNFTESYRIATAQLPNNIEIWLEWFRQLAQVKAWTDALKVIEQAETLFGQSHDELLLARLFIASESEDEDTAEFLFAKTAHLNDTMRDMAMIRAGLKKGEYKQAEAIALNALHTPSAMAFWPYLSLIWRMTDKKKSRWLDGIDSDQASSCGNFIKTQKLNLNSGQLSALKHNLNLLHTSVNPFAQQSVRGGTQTDQNLFLRHQPVIQNLKQQIQKQVKKYVASLPEFMKGHPLLGVDRQNALNGRIQFSGSWSVRLKSQGFNVSHTHPMGWISSALYIDLPSQKKMGDAPAGWLQFGTPPPELKMNLAPYCKIEPKAGQLVLFPSTMWHSTVPFEDGRRLVVAFDVKPPQSIQR